MVHTDTHLADWRERALAVEQSLAAVFIGQEPAIRFLLIAVFARGHALLEGDVGVGKTTVLRALARALGGTYERVEGNVDLMPTDLLYHSYIDERGQPRVEPGPLLRSGEELATFFFNEVNRARPQVHALLLRVMAEGTVVGFDRCYTLPHLLVFADRNRVEREETFEIPSAARDRFLMEIGIELPRAPEVLDRLMFDPRYHDTEALIEEVEPGQIPYQELNTIARTMQSSIGATETARRYALNLCLATREPDRYGVSIADENVDQMVLAGVSPRGMSMFLRAARVAAWLDGRENLVPEDLQNLFHQTVAHRICFQPVYELRRGEYGPALITAVLQSVASP
jgi:MoxR-like ATPase